MSCVRYCKSYYTVMSRRVLNSSQDTRKRGRRRAAENVAPRILKPPLITALLRRDWATAAIRSPSHLNGRDVGHFQFVQRICGIIRRILPRNSRASLYQYTMYNILTSPLGVRELLSSIIGRITAGIDWWSISWAIVESPR